MAISNYFLINGREYEWADICLNVGGVEISGFRGVSYKESQEKEPLHAKGNKPRSIQRGNKTFSGSLTFTQSEVLALKAAAGSLSLLDISTDIVIAYTPENSEKITVVTIRGAEFTDIEEKMSQGDKYMDIELPFVALGIIAA